MTLGAYLTQKETGTGRDYLRKLRDSERGRFDQEVQPIESEPHQRHQGTVEERVRLELGPAKRRAVKIPENSREDPPTGVPTPQKNSENGQHGHPQRRHDRPRLLTRLHHRQKTFGKPNERGIGVGPNQGKVHEKRADGGNTHGSKYSRYRCSSYN